VEGGGVEWKWRMEAEVPDGVRGWRWMKVDEKRKWTPELNVTATGSCK
jgi:hypothetical protein